MAKRLVAYIHKQDLIAVKKLTQEMRFSIAYSADAMNNIIQADKNCIEDTFKEN